VLLAGCIRRRIITGSADVIGRHKITRQILQFRPGCQGVPRNTILTDQPMVRDPLALRDGALERYSLSVRGGGDRYGFYIAGDYDHDEGVFHNSHDGRRSIRTNFAFTPNQQLDFQVNVGYVRNRLRLPLGDEAFNGLMLSASRGRPGRVFALSAGPGWGSLRPEITNRYNNQNKVDRVTLGSTFNYAPLTWFRNRFTAGMDYTSNQASIVSEPLSADSPLGLHAERIPRTYVYTVDYAGSVVRNLTNDIESTSSIGAQATSNKTETLAATGTGLGSPAVTTIGSFFGFVPVLFGAAVLTGDEYPSWLGWVAIVAGALGLLTGTIIYFAGFTTLTSMVLFPIASVLFTVWLGIIGYLLWQKTSVAEGTSARV
jgi:hypothetical protein